MRKLLLLKIAPDLNFRQIDAVLESIAEFGLDGIIATNTTLARPGPFAAVNEAGGLSGAPRRRLDRNHQLYFPRHEGAPADHRSRRHHGCAAAAGEKLDAGATLVQVYTGLIYRGPFFAAQVARALAGPAAEVIWL